MGLYNERRRQHNGRLQTLRSMFPNVNNENNDTCNHRRRWWCFERTRYPIVPGRLFHLESDSFCVTQSRELFLAFAVGRGSCSATTSTWKQQQSKTAKIDGENDTLHERQSCHVYQRLSRIIKTLSEMHGRNSNQLLASQVT